MINLTIFCKSGPRNSSHVVNHFVVVVIVGWALFKKPGSGVSNRIAMKFGRIVPSLFVE